VEADAAADDGARPGSEAVMTSTTLTLRAGAVVRGGVLSFNELGCLVVMG
jgi:hypothetical protein